VDGIFHLSRAFDDDDVVHVEGDVNPVRDLEIIHAELRKKDENFLIKKTEDLTKQVARIGSGGSVADKAKKEELIVLQKLVKLVSEDSKDVRTGDWSNKEVEIINSLHLLSAKPVVYLVNLSERDYARKKNKWLVKIKNWIDEHYPGDMLIPYSGALEEKLSLMESDTERQDYLKKLSDDYAEGKPVVSALPKIIVAGYQALNLIYCKLNYFKYINALYFIYVFTYSIIYYIYIFIINLTFPFFFLI